MNTSRIRRPCKALHVAKSVVRHRACHRIQGFRLHLSAFLLSAVGL